MNLYDAFETSPKVDPRRGYSIWAPGDVYGVFSGSTITANGITYNDGDTVHYQSGWSPSNMNTRKLWSTLAGQTRDQTNGYDLPLLRYAELLLFYSEALIENGQVNEGMAQLNKVRARPSVDMPALTATDQADARTKLRHERRVELNMEGVRLFDLMRWGILEDVFGTASNPKPILVKYGDDVTTKDQKLEFPKNNLFPLPQLELDINKKASQNPGY